LFEAARWAVCYYNEQPWNYLVATREAQIYVELLCHSHLSVRKGRSSAEV
jgi:hypothetical protein